MAQIIWEVLRQNFLQGLCLGSMNLMAGGFA